MSQDTRDVIQVLRYELNFLEQGGYERAVKAGVASSPFRSTYTCLNFGDPLRPHACHECLLYDFVPARHRTEDVPCHHIPLNGGETVAGLLKTGDKKRLIVALGHWLRVTIARLEAQREANPVSQPR